VRASLLGPFSVTVGAKTVGPWPRPSAKRLLELLFISPGRRTGRGEACEALFPRLGPAAAARELSKALSMARATLSPLGTEAARLIQADRTHIWADPGTPLEIDVESQGERIRSALKSEPGVERDNKLVLALEDEGTLLEDEPVAEWAVRPRERLEWDRQEARLALARDRARGKGRSQPEAVIEAWTSCLAHDPTSEEAASALIGVYGAQRRHALVDTTYERCRTALEELGLRISPALNEVYGASAAATEFPRRPEDPLPPTPLRYREERRLVSVLFAELSGPVGVGAMSDPEDVRQVLGGALAGVIAEVEGLGGTVTSVSGAGLAALFGAPAAHEDDPERAVRAGSRILSAIGAGLPPRPGALSARVGIETGPAVVGLLVAGAGYGAMGEVVSDAAAVQSAARAGSVLVGPVTRAATEGTFEWGPTEDVAATPGAKPLVASYLERPRARSPGYRGHARLAGRAPLVGRQAELDMLDEALREATSGTGSVVFLVGEPGLGKTRLVQECRKRFMAWVGAGTGRLPLWLEGRCAPYASSTPYGLYQQLLSAWTGAALEEGEEVARPALERAMKAIFGGEGEHVGLLAHMMSLRAGPEAGRLARLSPEGLRRATFAAVRAVVARLVERGPSVLVLEDLQWADPTSLRLTEELATLATEGPLLLLVTRRPEPDPGVSDIESTLEAAAVWPVRRVGLSPLLEEGEQALARSLVGAGAGKAVIEAVCAGVEGNPLFLEERFSSMVETGALVKDGTTWRLHGPAATEVPDVLERLIRCRVDRLAPMNREIITSASVLGREFAVSLLASVAEVEGELGAGLGELCAAGLLAEVRQLPETAYRFRHALIQEAVYRGMLRGQRRQLHARAAWGLETVSADRVEEMAAVLGHHYAAAGETERGVHHLGVAGDHAASVFANDEAISSYRRAVEIADHEKASDAMRKAAVVLRAKLADVLWRGSRLSEARQALQQALELVDPEQPFQAAGLRARLGRVEVEDHHFGAAVAAFDAASELLGDNPTGQDEQWADLWLEVQVDGRASLYYWGNEPDKAAVVLEHARPVVEALGSPARKAGFYVNLTNQRLRETRYRIDEESLANARAAVKAAEEGAGEHVMASALSSVGFQLLWHGDLTEAQEKLELALAIAERVGDPFRRAMCLCYLNLTALRRHDLDAVRSLAPRVIAAAEVARYPAYVAAGKATLAWVAWNDQRFENVVPLATEALDLWATIAVTYPFKWLCLWPLISVHLASGQLDDAVDASRQLLTPPQQRLPDELESVVEGAGAAWDRGDHQLATDNLTAALELAGYLCYA
jgi:DNA-binding SARP family transcriptional activator/tetratricopeptide (TPR) repeat protein